MSFAEWFYKHINTHCKLIACTAKLYGCGTSNDELISKSIDITFENKVFIFNSDRQWSVLREAEQDLDIIKSLNKKAEEWLMELRKENEIVERKDGVLMKGSHIVAVKWGLREAQFVDATYEEYLIWKTTKLKKQLMELENAEKQNPAVKQPKVEKAT
jgi:hypothetical protein